jgi:enoyl-CoA hydratase/carnithine racemase
MANPRAPIKLPKSYNDLPFMQIKTQHCEKDPSVIILTLYRPKNHNAFTNTMMLELEEAYGMFDVDDRVRVIVLTGNGRIFCAGADLEIGFQRSREPANEHRDGYVSRY